MIKTRNRRLTGHINRSGDEAVLPELPGLPDIYNYSFLLGQELLQLIISHFRAPWLLWAEPAELQLCAYNTSDTLRLRIALYDSDSQPLAAKLTFVSVDEAGQSASSYSRISPRRDRTGPGPQKSRDRTSEPPALS